MTKEDLKFYIPYAGTIIVLLGTVKLVLYYRFFHFAVLPYLEFTEILTLFLGDFLYFAAIVFIQNVSVFLLQSNSELEGISQGLHQTLTENKFFKRVYAYAINGLNLVMLAAIWVVGIPFWIIFTKQPFSNYLWPLYGLTGLWIVLIIIYESRRQWLIKFNTHPKMLYTNLAKLFLVLLILTVNSAYWEYDAAKNHGKYDGTSIILRDRTINCNRSYYFIGKVKNFIILHNDNTQTNDIIPITEIKLISEKKNSY